MVRLDTGGHRVCVKLPIDLNAVPDAAAAARRVATVAADAASTSIDRDVLELLTSELIADVVADNATPTVLTVDVTDRSVRVAVDEVAVDGAAPSRDGAGADADERPAGELIRQLADRYGVEKTAGGTIAWFEIDAGPKR